MNKNTMNVIPQITFRGIPESDAVRTSIAESLSRLERYAPRPGIRDCHVVLEAPPGHHHKGSSFRVHLTIAVPGQEIVINHDREKQVAHADLYAALRDAFDIAARKLRDSPCR
jgi:ribosome-associated translation inhibitor RaiA